MAHGQRRKSGFKIFDAHVHCSDDRGNDALSSYADTNGLRYDIGELLASMDSAGVYGGLLLSPPRGDGRPFPNSMVIELCARSRGKLFPVMTVEPSERSVRESLHLAKMTDAKGFKVRLGYVRVYADDKVFSPLYDYAEAHELPVLFHTGDTATAAGSLIHSHPLTLDPLANRRENLKMVVCHFGNPWIMDAAELIYKHPNVYADVSGLFVTKGAKYSSQYLRGLQQRIEEAIYFVGDARKVIFGTDYPIETHNSAVDFVLSLKVDGNDLTKILSENARGLFRI